MLTTMVRRSLTGNRRITVWTLATLTTCVALVVIFTTIALEVGRSMRHTLRELGANAVAHVAAGTERGGQSAATASGERARADFDALAKAVALAGGDMQVLALRPGIVDGEPVGVVSADGVGLERMTPYWNVQGRRATEPGECLVGRRTAEHFKVALEDELAVQFAGGDRTTLRVVGIFESGDEDENRIFTVTSELPGDAVPYALLSVRGGEGDIDRIASDADVLAAGTVVKPLRQIVHGEENVLAKVTLLCALALIVVVILASLGVTASVWARVVERRKEFALIQTLGATRRGIVRLLLAEGAALGGVAAVIGFILGALTARAIVQDVFGVTTGPHLAAFGAGLMASLLVSLAAGMVGVWRTQRILPAAALRNE